MLRIAFPVKNLHREQGVDSVGGGHGYNYPRGVHNNGYGRGGRVVELVLELLFVDVGIMTTTAANGWC